MRLLTLARRSPGPHATVGVLGVAALLLGSVVSGSGGTRVAVSLSASECALGTTVETSSGPVCGLLDRGVEEWLGIPAGHVIQA
jgi:hypothetical protein